MLCVTLTGWVLFQMMVVLSQHYYGPRYFIPAIFLPKKYNYFRPIPMKKKSNKGDGRNDIEAGGAIKPIVNPSCRNNSCLIETHNNPHNFAPECVICMAEIEDISSNNSNKIYMISPCNHIFHTECLRKWMEVKLECPTCRHPLPLE